MIQLTRREQRLAIGLTAAVALWAVYGFAVEPVRERIEDLRRFIPEKETELQEIQAKSAEYMRLRQGLEEVQMRMAEQDPNFELPSFAESLLEQQDLTTHATVDGYLGTVVKITLKDVALGQLVDFLKAIEASNVVAQVGSLHVYRSTSHGTLLGSLVEIYSPDPDQIALATDLTQP